MLKRSPSVTRKAWGKAVARFLPHCFPSASGNQKALIHTGDDKSEGFVVVIDEAVLEPCRKDEELVLLNGDYSLLEFELTPAHCDPTKLVKGPFLPLHMEGFGVVTFYYGQSVFRKMDIGGTTPTGELFLRLNVVFAHLVNR